MTNSSRNVHLSNGILKKTLFNLLDENDLVEWLSKNGKSVFYLLIGLAALFFLIYTMSARHSNGDEKDYLQASKEFILFNQGNQAGSLSSPQEAEKQLNALLAKHPELHAVYDGPIAQILLDRHDVDQAKPYIEATFRRTQSDQLPFYSDFATTSLMISEQHYKPALDRAQNLQKKMVSQLQDLSSDERSFGESLFAFNLLRIAMLQQQLGDRQGEMQAWQEWKSYAGMDKGDKLVSSKINPQIFHFLIQKLAIGNISLLDYIAYREKILKG